MPTTRLSFPGADGSELAARLDHPPGGAPRAWALFAHCFTCSKDLKAAVGISRELASLGYGVLRFDFTGLGESEGDFADTNFSSNVDDLVAAAEFLAREHEAPRLLVGHSLGGAAVIRARARIESIEAVATIGAPADPSHVLHHVEEQREEIESRGEATVHLGGRPFTIRRSFLEDLEGSTIADSLAELDAALLVMHSPLDRTVGIENARRIYQAARHPKSFLTLDTADHLLSDPEDASYAARLLGVWSERYLPARETAQDDRDDLTSGDRVVTRTGAEGFRTDVAVRGHRLTADEPEKVGGTNLGPTPYDLLLSGLGSCTSMTLRMYADRKGWPLEEARVRLRHSRLHRDDCEECESGDPRLDRVDREIELIGELDREQRDRLLEIADRCPVHRTLDAGVRVETTEAPGG